MLSGRVVVRSVLHGRDRSGLVRAASREFLTQRGDFGASTHVGGNVWRSPAGWYLVVSALRDDGEPVRAVGWALNDYWSLRLWGPYGYDYRNEYDMTAGGSPAPNLSALGWPHALTYSRCLDAARAKAPGRVVAACSYRLSHDGEFVSHELRAAAPTVIHFGDPNPEPTDVAVGIQIGLTGRRWRAHLSQIRAINDDARRRGLA